ncbi:hypothetical protein HZ992_04860 [Rhizobacter sp. AJA081-3]|uniref:hypothetical protein n=1 Tax=Rhizobacter sp. AJA081-3 TaxID=2753607 RepID=UPI001ADED1ED|nr:hypothetical protein [Rhizobacter sp. AJA081-3]QTN24334.1 hypothetical protein HZ992_04860 [Rhizobacter sp. AJA081-3]
MDTLREVVIDEARWPRMFAKLRRAGMYSSCGCAGCGGCQAAAQRFVRGIARGARYVGAWGGRPQGGPLSVFRSILAPRPMNVLVGGDAAAPAVIDISIDPIALGEGVEEHEDPTWRAAIASRAWRAGAAPRLSAIPEKIPGHPQSRWQGPVSFLDISRAGPNLDRVLPPKRGLYLIVWPHGAYLGLSAQHKGIQARVLDHLKEYYGFSFGPLSNEQRSQFRVYWLDMHNHGKPAITAMERSYLNSIIRRPLAEEPRATPERRAAYGLIGFRNRKELEAGLDTA